MTIFDKRPRHRNRRPAIGLRPLSLTRRKEEKLAALGRAFIRGVIEPLDLRAPRETPISKIQILKNQWVTHLKIQKIPVFRGAFNGIERSLEKPRSGVFAPVVYVGLCFACSTHAGYSLRHSGEGRDIGSVGREFACSGPDGSDESCECRLPQGIMLPLFSTTVDLSRRIIQTRNEMATVAMDIEKARFNMIQQQIRSWNVLDPGVLALLDVVRREDFVPAEYKELAFADIEIPLKSGARPGQTLLAPCVEARMLQELAIKNTDKVLEIGAGSGYMAALLAAKAEFVYSVEIDPELVDQARHNLRKVGVANVSVDLGDASLGWDLYAPYDAIVVSGSMPTLPDTLLRQLKIGGRLVAVVGETPSMNAQRVRRTDENAFSSENLFETVLVPLVNAPRQNSFVF
jgi:protein-L-isoaspartate(D-aspartate) O-methyltransferase